jgi:hypothetical protein
MTWFAHASQRGSQTIFRAGVRRQPGERHTQCVRSPGPVPSRCGGATAKQVCGSKRVGGVDVSCVFYRILARAAQSICLSVRKVENQSLSKRTVTITAGSQTRRGSCLGVIPASRFMSLPAFRKAAAIATRAESAPFPAGSSVGFCMARRAGNGSTPSWMDQPQSGGPSLSSASDARMPTRQPESDRV